ncbi:MAG: ATP--guanido phosphotransferase [Defluviitaleaceae bacterium]|nr:ATP--guanido phosphotransferase [Defluviitaleaceae bacterium]
MRWYEHQCVDDSAIISSRVRLARNLSPYPFPSRLAPPAAAKAIQEMQAAVLKPQAEITNGLTFVDLSHVDLTWLYQLSERHVISPAMANKAALRGLIYNNEENISIMLNEEDHLRIQAIMPQQNLDEAYEAAAALDDTMAAGLNYAFDADFGYLTSCPTNTGTGLRASYMLHLPLMESTGNLKAYADLITKAGFAIRGTHGEGTEVLGGIYQISNQLTMGKSEEETISALKHLANQIAGKEFSLRELFFKEYRHETEDAVHRAYGILTNCRKIGLAEAMKHLSDIRLGAMLGLLRCNIAAGTILALMINILPYNLQEVMGQTARDVRHLDVMRAEYLRKSIS